ncbi:Lrp/AsnC family transcriptional regulator [uncultured Roseovarius sp.]|uniref:Lrp/AsnC family transcriptional regulator n=1 Tax=uncultured Roseovarius sp. TaxID=293344 RepID=UPI002635579C|nr:Lrp/AsnC family transcriptional regulator [uncultured Roseovarius sp.]
MTLDDTDRLILNHLQEGFPIDPNPFQVVAKELEIPEAELIERLEVMKAARVITRFGPFYDAAAMGGAFCLCAMAIPDGEFDAVARQVNTHPEVAHNYERTHRLNMWFVLATETRDEIEEVAERIEAQTGHRVWLFPKLQEFFIRFRVAA